MNPTACLIIIGNEILSGRTQDKNLNFLAKALNDIGIRMMECRVIPDIADTIADTVNELRRRHDYVFTTGGIGPTHDDITAESVAQAFGLALTRHKEAEARLLKYYPPEKINAARMRMADTPEGARLIDNPISVAPGFIVENVYVMAGIPAVMQAMFEGIRGELKGGAPALSRSLTVMIPEGTIAAGLGDIQARYPHIDIGSYPFSNDSGGYGTSIVLRGTEKEALALAAAEVRELLTKAGDTPVEE